ncbi:glutamyl-tRNA(Gln) amidotransferase subunit B, chloroplastic/mitochondrial [Artemisia annua]|uniref:Glutamyl-tRNA(Gln) amidotransferase subunit B, chloroplastic/mitochondrial n=1 Tax=Artemisia annua TaxID=35608 RepID=A0A2U1PV33_ARTAN|nr:glutamyl-tRNA(Gln) amidotransferase subunit B, chloroplastic/mitochondrial [Artemisia annua]
MAVCLVKCPKLNRVGIPLLEIVSEPDMQTGMEAAKYHAELQRTVQYLGVGDGNMQEGLLWCDVNVRDVRHFAASTWTSKIKVMVNKFRRTGVFGKDIFKATNNEVEISLDLAKVAERKEFGRAKGRLKLKYRNTYKSANHTKKCGLDMQDDVISMTAPRHCSVVLLIYGCPPTSDEKQPLAASVDENDEAKRNSLSLALGFLCL